MDPGVVHITLWPPNPLVAVGGTVQLNATVTADAGVATTVAWSSASPGTATVNASGLVTGVGVGSVAIKACSTATGFSNSCGSTTLGVTLPIGATVEILGATWVPPAGGTGCAPGTGPAVPITPTTKVRCKIALLLRLRSGDQQMQQVNVRINNQVMSSTSVVDIRGVAPAGAFSGEISQAPISADITLPVNTAQIRRVGGSLLSPVVFNGNASIDVHLFVVGSAAPIASNPLPAVINNEDAIVIAGQGGPIPAITMLANTSVPSVTDDGGNTWFKGPATFSGAQYIAFSTKVPTALTFTSTMCGNSSSSVSGTAATGIVLSGGFLCAGLEGPNRVTGFDPPTYSLPLTGPDGTLISPPTGFSTLGSSVTVDGQETWQLPEPPLPLPVFPTLYSDNKGPVVTIGTIAFNPASGPAWIKADYNLINRVSATDGGPIVGGTPIKTRNVRFFGTSCNTVPLPSPHGLAESATSTGAGSYRVCGGATDFLDNPGTSGTSNNFGVELTPFTFLTVNGWTHVTGIPGVSLLCPLITTTPPRPGGTAVFTATGAGVVPGQVISPVTIAGDGTARPILQVNLPGTYPISLTVTSPAGSVVTSSGTAFLTSGANTCP